MVRVIFVKNFNTTSYDVGTNGQISLTSILRYFQEAAFIHANNLGVGYNILSEQNIFWALSSMWLETDNKLPGFNEQITVKTWPRGVNKLYSLRDFQLFHNKMEIARASSQWLLVDVKSKRIVRPDRFMETIPFSENRVFNNDFSPIEPIKIKNLTEERKVRYSDLDINRHVNNIRYVEWILDTVNERFGETNINSIRLHYLSEFIDSEKIIIYCEQTDCTNKIKVEIDHDDGKTGIRGEIKFVNR